MKGKRATLDQAEAMMKGVAARFGMQVKRFSRHDSRGVAATIGTFATASGQTAAIVVTQTECDKYSVESLREWMMDMFQKAVASLAAR